MPRLGSVWLEAVCLVPNPASFVMMAWIRCGSIWAIAARSSFLSWMWCGSEEPLWVVAASAEAAPETIGAAAAVAADADRNTRLLGPLRPETSLFSMVRIKVGFVEKSSYKALVTSGPEWLIGCARRAHAEG